jgi:putative ABC transport system permease protein
MFLKMLRASLLKKKIVTFVLFIFVVMAAFFCASGATVMLYLNTALSDLFSKTRAPHFVQMHEGALDRKEIEQWALQNPLVKTMQVVEMLKVDGSDVYIGKNKTSESNSVMSIDFVTQNDSFDFLLNLHGQVIHLEPGQIAVPIYYMQRYHLRRGDKIRIFNGKRTPALTIVDFARDVQMNPSIIHSKRFLIHSQDFFALKKSLGVANKAIYLIEFQLTDLHKLREFGLQYQRSLLPQHGPTIEYHLFKALNAVTDGMMIGMNILISILLTLVAILCLRFAILSTMEEEYRQIGIMKAIGVQRHYIRWFYLSKYVAVVSLGCGLGYLASVLFKGLFITHILLYVGSVSNSWFQLIVPLLAVISLFFIVLGACMLVLRRFDKISAVEALREGILSKSGRIKTYLPLTKFGKLNLNVILGFREVVSHFRRYFLLFFVFMVCSFVIILPINFFNTLQSPTFITYMGIERSDMRIDFQQGHHNAFQNSLSKIQLDKDVKSYAAMTTSRYDMINSQGTIESIKIQTGDFSVFPLRYLKGRTPQNPDEIALSYLNSKEMKKHVGDTLVLILDGTPKKLRVCGVYQDITNGGKTAKALIPANLQAILWQVVNVAFKPQVLIADKVDEYKHQFNHARVTCLNDYLAQTLGDFIHQIKIIVLFTIVVALCMSILMTSLFLNLLVAKDSAQIAVMKSIGFSFSHIRTQYLVRTLLVLNLGIVFGAMFSNTLGQRLVSLMWSYMGASEIIFIVNPLQIYVFCPLIFMGIVTLTTIINIAIVKKVTITKMVIE